MTGPLELPALYVEGKQDLHTIVHLLARHGIQLDKDLGPVQIKVCEGVGGVLAAMRTAARASTNIPVGFVLNTDEAVAARWQAVRERLKDVGFTMPSAAPQAGFIENATVTNSQVGVWIMPDNVTDQGKLEDLVRTLVPRGDKLIGHAHQSTVEARTHGAPFAEQDLAKAELHCWLAWQREPGLSFGTALKTHFFRHDSDVALRFVDWFKRLYSSALRQ